MEDAGAERSLKRKKTVTWADDEALEVRLAGDAAAARAASAAAPPPLLDADAAQADAAVVELPCDGMFEALSLDLLQQQVALPWEPAEEGGEKAAGEEAAAAGEEAAAADERPALTRRQLLERRLGRSRQLSELYEGELWGLLEELRLRHAQFTAQPGLGVWKDGGGGGGAAEEEEEGEASPRPTKRQKQAKQKQGKQGRDPAKAAAEVAAADEEAEEGSGKQEGATDGAPGARLRALWERQQPPAAQQQQQQQQPEKQGKEPGKAAAPKGKPGKQAKASPKEQQQQQPAGKAPRRPHAEQPGAGAPAEGAAAAAAPPPLPRFEDVEQLLLGGAAAGLPPVDEAALVAARASFVRRLDLLGRLEQGALAATCRELDALGGLALLCGRRRRYVLRRGAVTLGRCTESQGKVDVDLTGECEAGSAQRVSRQQAQLFLDGGSGAGCGGWRLRCTGRRPLLVNGQALMRGQTAALPTLSHIRVGDVSLLFVSNTAAEARALGRGGALLGA